MEVVRYDRAGKWWLEPVEPGRMLPARQVSLREAAWYAHDYGTEVFFRLPGGAAFDRLVEKLGVEASA